MKENLGVIPLLVIFAFVLIIAIFIVPMQERADKKYIQEWAAENSVSVAQVERHFWDIGPFWHHKNTRIYRVDLEDGRVFWFRLWIWGTDIEEYPK